MVSRTQNLVWTVVVMLNVLLVSVRSWYGDCDV